MTTGSLSTRPRQPDAGPIYTIRPARHDDIPALNALWRASAELHAAHDPEFYGLASDPLVAMRGYWEGVLVDGSHRCLVADAGALGLIGCGQADIRQQRAFARSRRGHLSNVWVEPAYRRQGLGRRLVTALVEWLRIEGAELVILNVGAHNAAALAFYAALGFRPANVNHVLAL